MITTVSQIIKDVRVAIDEATPTLIESIVPQIVASQTDTTYFDISTLIRSTIIKAATLIYQIAPIELLDAVVLTPIDHIKNVDGTGYFILPDDFLRLGVLKLKTFKRPIVSIIYDTNPEYKKQCNKYSRAGSDRPVGVISSNHEGNAILEYYSVKANDHTIERFTYIPYPAIAEEELEVAEKIYDSFILMSASMTLLSLKQADFAALLKQSSVELLNIQKNG